MNKTGKQRFEEHQQIIIIDSIIVRVYCSFYNLVQVGQKLTESENFDYAVLAIFCSRFNL